MRDYVKKQILFAPFLSLTNNINVPINGQFRSIECSIVVFKKKYAEKIQRIILNEDQYIFKQLQQ